MTSITGGQHHFSSGHEQHVSGSAQPVDAGRLSLASITEGHTSFAGGGADTVGVTGGGSGADTVSSGFDTVSGPGQGASGFVGQVQGATENVVATQTTDGGNTILQLHDGSTITIVGTTQIDQFFSH
jgi:hypothetical protein